ncbi:MAG TPA: hypothetical protein VKB88_20135 [Bryobacteraceae bacterium]|nr:hypothetical protein [Bryobacteraceae bacterium]
MVLRAQACTNGLGGALVLCAAGTWWAWHQKRILSSEERAPAIKGIPPANQTGAVFVLEPGLLRDSGPPAPFHVPAGSEEIQLQVYLEGRDFDCVDAQLTTPEGRLVWGGVNIKVGAKQVVTMPIPTDRLTSGDYLSSIYRGQTTTEAGEYAFRIAVDPGQNLHR